jgi:hypothetical protein
MSDRFIPITAGTSQEQMLAMINKNFAELDNESTTKVFRGQNGHIAVIEGKLPYNGGFGSIYYDTDGNSRIIIGVDPDGAVNIHVSKTGHDLVSLF